GRCHADPKLMGEFNIPATIPDQYRKSIHGRNVLEKGDSGSPTCATCHGSHAATPPGFVEVSHVCGRCHKQVEEYFLTSTHGRIPAMARCIGCHGKGGDRRNHQIEKASPSMDVVLQTYLKTCGAGTEPVETLRQKFVDQIDAQSGLRLDVVCSNCHASGRRHDPHSVFFETTDQEAAKYGKELAGLLRDAQFEYARTAERTNRLGRGVLLLKDEALRLEDAKTEVMALTTFIHTLNRPEIVARDQKVRDICKEVNGSLDQKESGVVRWRISTLPIWAFIALFSVLMYKKYLSLRRAYVAPDAAHPIPAGACPLPSGLGGVIQERRRFFDVILSVMGSFAVVGLLWPAISYVLPVRKRGGAADRVSAGKEDGWQVWEGRKVSVNGKPAIVVRTDKGFTAHSAVCTHLGCIVHWTPGKKEFECPCHAARFDGEGQVIAGPPPGPLPSYSAAVVQGEVMVSPAKSA
ncbi:MAG TPA: Rieske 2Fe-2S domain-containing protein, partial [Phycisphaerae bacterium]|nr:Rieske 2Fe-2S domain-containing protein [Phycisphaerae bacterium]